MGSDQKIGWKYDIFAALSIKIDPRAAYRYRRNKSWFLVVETYDSTLACLGTSEEGEMVSNWVNRYAISSSECHRLNSDASKALLFSQ